MLLNKTKFERKEICVYSEQNWVEHRHKFWIFSDQNYSWPINFNNLYFYKLFSVQDEKYYLHVKKLLWPMTGISRNLSNVTGYIQFFFENVPQAWKTLWKKKLGLFSVNYTKYLDGLADKCQSIAATKRDFQVCCFGGNFTVIRLTVLMYVTTEELFKNALLKKVLIKYSSVSRLASLRHG